MNYNRNSIGRNSVELNTFSGRFRTEAKRGSNPQACQALGSLRTEPLSGYLIGLTLTRMMTIILFVKRLSIAMC